MPAELDVYKDWLGIQDSERPLNYYQLLRLKKFEDDPVRIRAHYRKLNAHVRKYAAGDYAAQSQDLLNELAKAMLCLTDAKRKGEYDASLGREDAGERKKRSFEQLLLLRKVLDQEKLDKARQYADAVGLDLRDALLQQKLVKPEIAMQVYAESLGLPYLDLRELPLEESFLRKVPAVMARQHSCAPVMIDDGIMLLASPMTLKPEVEDELRLRLGMPVRSVLCTTAAINEVVSKHYPKDVAAAEMAAGLNKPAAAVETTDDEEEDADEAADDDKKKKAKKAQTPTEAKKQQAMITLVAFNITFIGSMIYLTSIKLPPAGFIAALGISFVLAAVVGGTTFIAQKLTE